MNYTDIVSNMFCAFLSLTFSVVSKHNGTEGVYQNLWKHKIRSEKGENTIATVTVQGLLYI